MVFLSTTLNADLLADFLGLATFLSLELVFANFLGLSGDFPTDFGFDLPAELLALRIEEACFFTLVGLFFEVFNGNSVPWNGMNHLWIRSKSPKLRVICFFLAKTKLAGC